MIVNLSFMFSIVLILVCLLSCPGSILSLLIYYINIMLLNIYWVFLYYSLKDALVCIKKSCYKIGWHVMVFLSDQVNLSLEGASAL